MQNSYADLPMKEEKNMRKAEPIFPEQTFVA